MVDYNGVRIHTASKQETIDRMKVYIRRFERRYECPSQHMLEAVEHGLVKETAEISKWLSNYRVLKSLEKPVGCDELPTLDGFIREAISLIGHDYD